MKKIISFFTAITIIFVLTFNTAFATEVSNTDITSDSDVINVSAPAAYIEDENSVQTILCPEDEWEEVKYDYFEWDEEPAPPIDENTVSPAIENNNDDNTEYFEEVEEDDHIYDSYFPITEPTFEGLCVVNIDYNSDHTIIEFNDGSWGAYGHGEFIFQPVIMGKYSYFFSYDTTCYPMNEFIGCVLTYADNMYGNNLDYIPDGNGTDIMYLVFSTEDIEAYEKRIGEMEEMRIGAEG